MQNFEVHACTDITGFGLIGHGWEMAKGSSLGLKISASQVPIFAEALPLAKKGMLTRGDKSNREYVKGSYLMDTSISKEVTQVLFDPQTSGGLLISISPGHAEALLKKLWERGISTARIIGEVIDKPGQVVVWS
jgi:selenide,water dikinase